MIDKDDVSIYKASNYRKNSDDVSQYKASNFLKKKGKKKEGRSFLSKLPGNIATGVTELGRGLANTPHNLANLIGQGDKIPNFAPPDFNYSEAYGLPEEKTLSDKLIQGVAQYGPSLAIPGSSLGKIAAGQAAFGATQNENPLMGAAEGGLGALAGGFALKGVAKGYNALRPSKLLRGELSPEQLTKNLENTKGTETSLGDVIESPTLKKLYENVLPNVLGSGTDKAMQRTAKKIIEKGEGILKKSRGGESVSENYGHKIKEALTEASGRAEQEKNNLFSHLNELAEKEGVTTSRSNLRSEAKKILEQIKSDTDLAKFTNSGDIKLLEDIVNPLKSKNVQANTVTGKPIQGKKEFSLKNTDILRGKIGENAYEASVKGEKPKASIYTRLKNAVEKDINESIDSSSSAELKEARDKAMSHYKNEYAPFMDKDIRKFVKQGGDPDLILNHFLKTGKNDRQQLLKKLTEATGEGGRTLLGNAYLAPAYENGQLNPIKLKSLYNKLGKNQRKELFGEKLNRELKELADLTHKNNEAFSLMFNPKTGARLGHIGAVAAGLSGHGLPGLIATSLSGRAATKALTSEKLREKLVNAMISENKNKTKKPIELLLTKGSGSFGSSKKTKQ